MKMEVDESVGSARTDRGGTPEQAAPLRPAFIRRYPIAVQLEIEAGPGAAAPEIPYQGFGAISLAQPGPPPSSSSARNVVSRPPSTASV